MCSSPASWNKMHPKYNIFCPQNYSKKYRSTKECKEKTKQTNIIKYGVDNPAKSKEIYNRGKRTCKEKCGTEHYSQSQSFKDKKGEIVRKIKGTTKSKHSAENFMQSEEFSKISSVLVQKRKETLINNFGVDNYTKSLEYKEKLSEINQRIRKTCKEKYLVDWHIKTEESKEKRKIMNMEKYGVENYSQSEEFKDKREETYEKIKKANLKKYGVENYFQSEECKKKVNEKYLVSCASALKEDGFEELGYRYVKCLGDGIHVAYCPHCNTEFKFSFSNDYFHRKSRNQEICTNCNPIGDNISCAEKELLEFVKSIYDGEIQENARDIIPPYELDIFLPEKNIAIEYNGLWWHSEKYKTDNYHLMKSNLCKEKEIHLVHVFEDDWKHKQGIVKSVIKNFLGCGHQRIFYARKLQLKEVPSKQMQEFLVANHMLGRVSGARHCIGLWDGEELLSLMSFSSGFNKEGETTLSRYAIRQDVNIKGGAEKIFSHFLKTYGHLYDKAKTFNDNGVFKGSVHYRLGFQHTGDNPPNYMYIDLAANKRVSKQSIRQYRNNYKRNDVNEFKDGRKFYRIYNAGNDTCEFIIPKSTEK